jgi:hypothetical protein
MLTPTTASVRRADIFDELGDKGIGQRLNPVRNFGIEHNVGDRVVHEYNSFIQPPTDVDPQFHGMNTQAGTIVAKHPPERFVKPSPLGFGPQPGEPTYHVQWDLGADWSKPQPYYTPGEIGEHVPQHRLWPEGHEALDMALDKPMTLPEDFGKTSAQEFREGQPCRLNEATLGQTEGREGATDAGQWREIPRNAKVDVVYQDPSTGWVEILFPLKGGPMTSYHIRCFVDPSVLTPLEGPGAFQNPRR